MRVAPVTCGHTASASLQAPALTGAALLSLYFFFDFVLQHRRATGCIMYAALPARVLISSRDTLCMGSALAPQYTTCRRPGSNHAAAGCQRATVFPIYDSNLVLTLLLAAVACRCSAHVRSSRHAVQCRCIVCCSRVKLSLGRTNFVSMC